jgi:hypothetical protein
MIFLVTDMNAAATYEVSDASSKIPVKPPTPISFTGHKSLSETTGAPSQESWSSALPFKCYLCFKLFYYSGDLSRHQMSHAEQDETFGKDTDATFEFLQSTTTPSIDDLTPNKGPLVSTPPHTPPPPYSDENLAHVGNTCLSNTSPDLSVGDDTNSSCSDVDTDWGEEEMIECLQGMNISAPHDHNTTCISSNEETRNLISSTLSPIKQNLVDRLMDEFWAILNQCSSPKK